jgi:AraC-like DNA-binding protein/quercetin dioxygenase-like cupin family protein
VISSLYKSNDGNIMDIPIESINFQMLNVGFAQHDSDWNWQHVCSPFIRIYIVTEGSAKVHTDKSIIELKPGFLYMIPAFLKHSYECNGPFSHYYLHFYEKYRKENDLFELYSFPTEVKADENDLVIFQEMCKNHPDASLPASNPCSYDNSPTFAYYVNRYNLLLLHDKMRLRGSILLLFSRFMEFASNKVTSADARVSKAIKYIHDNIHEDITVNILAATTCVTKNYFIRLFRQEMGQTPLQFVNMRKIEFAQLLLLTEDKTVKEISFDLGFNDYSYFIRIFKKLTGTTPNNYRITGVKHQLYL